jgi:hypothetical protein
MNKYFDKITFLSLVLFIYIVPIAHLYRYHSLIGDFSLPNNLFNDISLLISFIIIVYFIVTTIQKINNISKTTFLFFLFFFYVLFYSILHYMNYNIISSAETLKYFKFTYNIFISYITYFIIGYYYRGYQKYYKYLLIFYIFLTVNTWWNIDLNTLYISFAGVAKAKAGLYQYLGDTYAIYAILIIILTNNNIIKILLIIISFASLFILMSRSSLYVFTLVMIVYMIIKYQRIAFVYISIMVLAVALFVLYGGEYVDIIMNSRLMSFTRGIENDGSVAARIQLAKVGFEAIRNYWITGDYGGDVIYFHAQGQYIHNFFSILRQFGIVAFLLYSYFIWMLFIKIFKWMKKSYLYSTNYDYFIIISLYVVVEVIIARAWGNAYIFLAIGMLANLRKNSEWIYKLRK